MGARPERTTEHRDSQSVADRAARYRGLRTSSIMTGRPCDTDSSAACPLGLMARLLGEHAQIQAGSSARREVDDDIRVVQDVRLLAPVTLVEVVHVAATGTHHPNRLVPE